MAAFSSDSGRRISILAKCVITSWFLFLASWQLAPYLLHEGRHRLVLGAGLGFIALILTAFWVKSAPRERSEAEALQALREANAALEEELRRERSAATQPEHGLPPLPVSATEFPAPQITRQGPAVLLLHVRQRIRCSRIQAAGSLLPKGRRHRPHGNAIIMRWSHFLP